MKCEVKDGGYAAFLISTDNCRLPTAGRARIMDKTKHFDDSYDVIVIGGALAGMASALTLCSKGKKVLVLEQHNLPGGVATSFEIGRAHV